MIKKRLLSFLGAAAITAALTFAVVSLSPSNGFTSGRRVSATKRPASRPTRSSQA